MTDKSGNVTSADFIHELYRRFDDGADEGTDAVTVTAGELHKCLHAANRLSLASNALYDVQNLGDEIVTIPSGGVGASLAICYILPREKGINLDRCRYAAKTVSHSYESVMKKFDAYAGMHPVLRGLADIVRLKKSEKAAGKLGEICTDAAVLVCKLQGVRADNRKFGTLCGALRRAGLLSDEGMYALDFVRICGNSNARRIPDEYLLTPKVFSFEAYAAAVFFDDILNKRLLWKKE